MFQKNKQDFLISKCINYVFDILYNTPKAGAPDIYNS